MHQRLVQSHERVRSPGMPDPALRRIRSEEHTSELQSPCNLVCRLLLEKKKKISERQSLCHIECRLLLRKTNSQTRSHLAKLTDGCVGLSTVLASYLGMRLVPDRALSR